MTEDAGISLHELLNTVSATLKKGMPSSYWVHAEILKADRRNYWSLELSGYDGGEQRSKARAMIWGSNNSIVDRFERTTGSTLKPGLKILFQCTVQFHAEYGLSLTITNIDPRFTLGDMEAKLQSIRDRLMQLREFERNKQFVTPSEFCRVAVIAPFEAAGLGDFRSQADKLSDHGLCHFDYFQARFQGENAPETLIKAMSDVINSHNSVSAYDALVIIRGGGDKAGLYELNDAKIARGVCRCPLPVFVGIGHDRDQTILDEVANLSFPTPSLVISHIRACIVKNAQQARIHMQILEQKARDILMYAKQDATQLFTGLHHQANHQIAQSKQFVMQLRQEVELSGHRSIQASKQNVTDAYSGIRYLANTQIGQCRQYTQALSQNINHNAAIAIKNAGALIEHQKQSLNQGTTKQLTASRQALEGHRSQITALVPALISNAKHTVEAEHQALMAEARQKVAGARNDVTRLIEQILLQDPKKILSRGFALVSTTEGKPLTKAADLAQRQRVNIQFNDGNSTATIEEIIND